MPVAEFYARVLDMLDRLGIETRIRPVGPEGAYYSTEFQRFVLPYEAARRGIPAPEGNDGG
jgi:hypothetical protein